MLSAFNQEQIQMDSIHSEDEDDFYFIGQHLNTFEIANRVYYATVDKFNNQIYTKQRSTPYSFRECWHLHTIYSKSQQTLLGIHPIKPSVLLCGEDFLFTHELMPQQPPQHHQDTFYFDSYEEEWNVQSYPNLSTNQDLPLMRSLSSSSLSSRDKKYDVSHDEYPSDVLGSTTHLFRVSSHPLPSPSHQQSHSYQSSLQDMALFDRSAFNGFTEEFYNTTMHETDQGSDSEQLLSSSSDSSSIISSIDDDDNRRRSFYTNTNNDDDDNELSSYDLMNLYDTTFTIDPDVHRSSTFFSSNSYVTARSQPSLKGTILENSEYSSLSNYGSAVTHLSEQASIRSSSWFIKTIKHYCQPDSLLNRLVIYIISLWNLMLSLLFKSSQDDQREPLLPK
jgi:hypothetical protein